MTINHNLGKPRGSKRTHDDSEDEQLEVVTLNKTKRRRTDSPPSKLSLPVKYSFTLFLTILIFFLISGGV